MTLSPSYVLLEIRQGTRRGISRRKNKYKWKTVVIFWQMSQVNSCTAESRTTQEEGEEDQMCQRDIMSASQKKEHRKWTPPCIFFFSSRFKLSCQKPGHSTLREIEWNCSKITVCLKSSAVHLTRKWDAESFHLVTTGCRVLLGASFYFHIILWW